MNMTPAGKVVARKINEQYNGGIMKCDRCTQAVIKPKKDQKGESTSKNSAEVDHHDQKRKER
jgi:hypothetical protein